VTHDGQQDGGEVLETLPGFDFEYEAESVAAGGVEAIEAVFDVLDRADERYGDDVGVGDVRPAWCARRAGWLRRR
jgi:hypothetical protein